MSSDLTFSLCICSDFLILKNAQCVYVFHMTLKSKGSLLYCPKNNHLLLLIKRFNHCKVLACSTTFFHLTLSCVIFFQFRTFNLFMSSETSSSHRVFGLPVGLWANGFRLYIFFTLLSSLMCSTWPNQFNRFLINPIIFSPFNISLISWLVLILQ